MSLEENAAMRSVQAALDRFVPDKAAQKWVWFVLLWLFGLISLTVLAYGLRLVMGIA